MTNNNPKVALITGASRGLGKALAHELAHRGWQLLLTARGGEDLAATANILGARAVAGDVADPAHRERLVAEIERLGGIDLLVNNASSLGTSPLPRLADYPREVLTGLFDTNVVAPLALIQDLLPRLRERDGSVINISSDAATGGYEGWGGYGATKAALDQVSNVLAAEEPGLRVWWVDPGEMRTDMLAAAVGAEAEDAPVPETVAAPAIAGLVESRPASGRYVAADLVVEAGAR